MGSYLLDDLASEGEVWDGGAFASHGSFGPDVSDADLVDGPPAVATLLVSAQLSASSATLLQRSAILISCLIKLLWDLVDAC